MTVVLLIRVGGEIDSNAEYVSTSGNQQLPEAAVVGIAVALLIPLSLAAYLICVLQGHI